jgi:hypothetical protein
VRGKILVALSIANRNAEHELVHGLKQHTVRTDRRMSFVLADEIDWIEAVGDYAGLHVGNNKPSGYFT